MFNTTRMTSFYSKPSKADATAKSHPSCIDYVQSTTGEMGCGVVVLWCCGVVVLWCCGVVVLKYLVANNA
jgi:hypothetical protein